jgi:hypothetical protein
MHYLLTGLLICILLFAGDNPTPSTLGPTAEERKVVAAAQDYLKKMKQPWGTPIEVQRPPNRLNLPDWKKYVKEEKHTWKVLYETPKQEMRALGPRSLFVNVRTNKVTPNLRK